MLGLVSKRKYKKLEAKLRIAKMDKAKATALKNYYVMKYIYPDDEPILLGGEKTYQNVLEEIKIIEQQKKMVLEKQKVEKENNEKRN